MGYSSETPRVVADYFGEAARTNHPIIRQIFYPEKGWRRMRMNKRITASYARSLKKEGATAVMVAIGARAADFRIAELT